jgi:phage shock protein PspC (stress-responsive transcriptional regulator)
MTTMYRSFTERVLAGICGGLGEAVPLLNAWVFRVLFVLLTLLTYGAFAVLYIILWMLIPQQTLAQRQRGGWLWLIITLGLALIVGLGWYGRQVGLTSTPAGSDLYYPGLFALFSVVFFIRQLGRSA